jgi:hypothetical protein
MVMMRLLELLGPEQRVGEVDKKTGSDDAGKPIVEDHGSLLEPVAGVSVSNSGNEETKTQRDEDEV